jgi:hypothetical protein
VPVRPEKGRQAHWEIRYRGTKGEDTLQDPIERDTEGIGNLRITPFSASW